MLKKTSFLTLMLAAAAMAEIRFDPVVLDAIKYNECDIINERCHPFTIRLNTKNGRKKATKLGFDVDRGLVRFKYSDEAVSAAKLLIEAGVKNMDMGAYQINYRFHPSNDLDIYFDEARARDFASKILSALTEQHGYSWETLGRYHSGTADLNREYYLKLHQYIYGYRP